VEFTPEEVEELTVRIQNAGTEVVEVCSWNCPLLGLLELTTAVWSNIVEVGFDWIWEVTLNKSLIFGCRQKQVQVLQLFPW
jgi:hypothetical protein